MNDTLLPIFSIFGAAGLVLALAMLIVALRGHETQTGSASLLIPLGVSLIWCALIVADHLNEGSLNWIARTGDVAAKTAWIWYFFAGLRRHMLGAKLPPSATPFLVCGFLAALAAAALNAPIWSPVTLLRAAELLAELYVTAHLFLDILIIALIENMLTITRFRVHWSQRLIYFGLGTYAATDLLYYGIAFLSGAPSSETDFARGLLLLVIALLITAQAIRVNQAPPPGFGISRSYLFRTRAIISFAGLLMFLGLASFIVRQTDQTWTGLFQYFLVIASVGSALLLTFSRPARRKLMILLHKNFRQSPYDYRDIWMRQLGTLSESGTPEGLERRILRAMSDLLDSPGGGLWVAQPESKRYTLVDRIRLELPHRADEPINSPLVAFLERRDWVIYADDWRCGDPDYDDVPIPAWAQNPDVWLIVPLRHKEGLTGFIALARGAADVSLDWEDRDLLQAAAAQAASFLAFSAMERKLGEARRFETFSQNFAFVMHDIKNIVSQLSLVTRNAEKHKQDPAFIEAMIETVHSSVTKMDLLLQRLKKQSEPGFVLKKDEDLNHLCSKLVDDCRNAEGVVRFTASDQPVWCLIDNERLEAALTHLLANALDAAAAGDENAGVDMALSLNGDTARISIRDQGPGMSQSFIDAELFAPFTTTKESGYGIGAYEARTIIQDHDGELDVQSSLGVGTSITVSLPVSKRTMLQSKLSEHNHERQTAPADH